MELKEIEKRMGEIKDEIENDAISDERLTELEQEVEKLSEERKKLEDAEKRAIETHEKRQSLLNDIAKGKKGRKIDENIDIKEERKMENVLETKEYRNAFLMKLQGREKELETEQRTMVDASAVIPTMTINKIIEKLEQTSAIYNAITVSNFNSNLSIPVEDVKNDASWIAIEAASTDSEDKFKTVELGAYKLIKTIEIGADVAAMSIDAFEVFIVNALSKKIARAVEQAIFKGTGTNQPTGLLKDGELTQTEEITAAGMTYADLLKIIAKLPTLYNVNARFALSRELFFKEILGMVGTDKKPIVVADVQNPTRYVILGFPVEISDYMPVDTVLFGDFSYYHFNWAKAMELSADTSVGFRTGSTVYRAMALADGKPTVKEAFVVAKKAAAK